MERKLLVKVVLVSAASIVLTLLVIVGGAWAADIFTVDKDGTVRLVVTDTGMVGIGTPTPQSTLHIQSGTGGTNPWFVPEVRIQSASASCWMQNTAPAGGFGSLGVGASSGHMFLSYDSSKDFRIQSTNGVAFDQRLSVQGSTGNVGVGTTDPKTKLHVTGLPEYAGNAAAIAAGLTAGAFYRTGEFLKVVY